MKLPTNIKLIFASWKGSKRMSDQAHAVTIPLQGSSPVALTKVTTKTSVNQTPERTGQWDWSDVTAPPRGDPTLQLTFISSQITWVWLSPSFAQRGTRESSMTTLTCIIGMSLGFGEAHVRPVVWDKCPHTWCQTWERKVSREKHTPILGALWAQRDLSENRLRGR